MRVEFGVGDLLPVKNERRMERELLRGFLEDIPERQVGVGKGPWDALFVEVEPGFITRIFGLPMQNMKLTRILS